MPVVLDRRGDRVVAVTVDDDAVELHRIDVAAADLIEWMRGHESREHPRWVWSDTTEWYPALLGRGIRVERAVDLRLCRRILRSAEAAAGSRLAAARRDAWDRAPIASAPDSGTTLFDLSAPAERSDPLDELRLQTEAVAQSAQRGVLALLLAAESVGALTAAEMSHAGLPWSASRHDEILTDLLGARPVAGRPRRMEELVVRLRELLEAPDLDPDSPERLLRALQNAGLPARSTRSWELKEIEHPVIAPLLEYKKMARVLTANGWNWVDTWVHEGRFRPVYVVGGVVTGRWASDGGGALQLPHQVRGAVVADPGWKLVVADAAQLEPRVLAAMSGDAAMARAGRAHDLYEGIVASGAVADRSEAKYGMLGAIYGGTTGVSGRVLPRMRRAFPAAMALVEDAARAGERGERVRTWLGRTSPAGRGEGYDETLTDEARARARTDARSWGRFTRNFVVQGTAAEWAMCWMGALRRRLWQLGEGAPSIAPEPFARRPHLAFFLHDEVVVHAPAELADRVAEEIRSAAADAGRMLFPAAPVEWALTVAIVDSYDRAK
ncbi:bifunctional 3'-5' exonuclease/DNA polymerase [Schumannella sp. 10F1B-5-1]|uniref:bifunctional 3'-5' exonuclease/DNA polymerase n=1 Tax=Schumannella sp. 10F1B-5-1 TaxID=2590780 RepID=UPI0011313FDF|nr:bifunctional 3'-5' exonuclease/DNA polymerase [Schumannella sp. 10F1B-5-1]TPW70832.1 bifunctional 3'-5' exonuclease/DNA polymerase [Schumannella sp. 10F1B-5-1]